MWKGKRVKVVVYPLYSDPVEVFIGDGMQCVAYYRNNHGQVRAVPLREPISDVADGDLIRIDLLRFRITPTCLLVNLVELI